MSTQEDGKRKMGKPAKVTLWTVGIVAGLAIVGNLLPDEPETSETTVTVEPGPAVTPEVQEAPTEAQEATTEPEAEPETTDTECVALPDWVLGSVTEALGVETGGSATAVAAGAVHTDAVSADGGAYALAVDVEWSEASGGGTDTFAFLVGDGDWQDVTVGPWFAADALADEFTGYPSAEGWTGAEPEFDAATECMGADE